MNTVYLDHAATTPLRPEVREAMAPFLGDVYGNPSSSHRVGRRAAAALEDARERVADALGVRPTEILFVRGGTESDNLAVVGRAAVARRAGRTPVVAHTTVEHSAVLEASGVVEEEGGMRYEVGTAPDGRLDEAALDAALERSPDVLSVMWVNNETGTVLPVGDVARRAREAAVAVHTDAVQAVGKVPVDLADAPVDLLTATGHKIGGPRGTGILFVREGTELRPLVHGGGQERGLRPGTEDVMGAVGMAEALALALTEREDTARRLASLRDELEDALLEGLPGVRIHGGDGPRAPHILNVGIRDVHQDLLLAGLDMRGVACSGGSACHSGAHQGAASSHVLRALHGRDVEGYAALRFSFGHTSSADDVERALEATREVVEHLRGEQHPSPAAAPDAADAVSGSGGGPSARGADR